MTSTGGTGRDDNEGYTKWRELFSEQKRREGFSDPPPPTPEKKDKRTARGRVERTGQIITTWRINTLPLAPDVRIVRRTVNRAIFALKR